jgi:Na+-translocating ferredoxin:NAD+ oxidoreductase subunit B
MGRNQEVYRELLKVMSKRGGLYAGLDIPEFFELIYELFTSQEAEINNAMPEGPFTPENMVVRMGMGERELTEILERMADKGLCSTFQKDGIRYYKAAAMMPGILEFQLMPGKATEKDRKVAKLIQAYSEAYESVQGTTKLTYPRSRVITVDRTIAAGNTIHTYDQVSSYINKYKQIALATCYCRHLASLLDEDTHGMPMEVCMWFGEMAEFAVERLGARKVDKEEAREALEQSEEAGLVHMSRNVTEDIEFMCNCDRWHCRAMKLVSAQPRPGLFFNSGFQPKFDPYLCVACETCLERCPAAALVMGDEDIPEVDLDKCFGCGVCATGCSEEAITMVSKPEFSKPPKDMKAFEAAVMASMS